MAGPLAIGTRVLVTQAVPGTLQGFGVVAGDDNGGNYLVVPAFPQGPAYVPYASAAATPWRDPSATGNPVAGGAATTGATGTATVSGGQVTGVSVTSGGTDYGLRDSGANISGSGVPQVTFHGACTTRATATATVVNGTVTAVTITNGGSGYNSAPIVMFF